MSPLSSLFQLAMQTPFFSIFITFKYAYLFIIHLLTINQGVFNEKNVNKR